MFVGNVLNPVVVLHKRAAAHHIAARSKVSVLVDPHIPPVCLIINVVDQVLRHRDGLKLLDIHPPQLLLGVDVGIKIVAVQVLSQIYQILDAAGVLPAVHDSLKHRQLVLGQLRQQAGQMVQLVNALVLTQVLMELGHTAVIVGNKKFLIPNTVYPDLFQGRLDSFGVGGERHPLIYKLALVVLAQVRHTGFKYRYTVSLPPILLLLPP